MSIAYNETFSIMGSGRLLPCAFGARGDGYHNDTNAIQTALDSLDRIGGGTLYFDSGTYMVSTIRLGKKTSLVGCGNGATIIKQIKGTKADCVVVQAKSAALRISNLSIVGNDSYNGIIIENSKGGNENHPYLYSKDIKDGVPQPYKWMTIDDICIYHFGTGLHVEQPGYNINICNSTFSHNGTGVIMKCTDSSIYNCFVTNNNKSGLILTGSNIKVSNIKSIWNGIGDAPNSAAIAVVGSRNQLINCETQDNYCKGFVIKGQYNLLSNCMSNTDGYFAEPKKYNPSIKACGFWISGLYNSFSNCLVTSYTEKFGAVFHSPVIVEESVASYYPNVFENIKILVAKDMQFFHEPYKNVEALSSKGNIANARIESFDDNRYFVSTQKKNNTIKDISCQISNLGMLIDYKCFGEDGQIMEIDGDERYTLGIEKKKICLKLANKCIAELSLDDDAVLNQDDMRLIVLFSNKGDKRTVFLSCYEKTAWRGWIKKVVRQDLDKSVCQKFKKVDLRIGDADVPIKRFVITNNSLPESVFLPYSNTNRIYDSALVYFDADSYLQ